MSQKIEMGRQYRTRDGRPVRVLCVDKKDPTFPVLALVLSEGEESAKGYTSEGSWCVDLTVSHDFDLIEVSPFDGLKIDDKVFVRNSSSSAWTPRHYAGNEDGKIRAFPEGRTSHTSDVSVIGTFLWNEWKLPAS